PLNIENEYEEIKDAKFYDYYQLGKDNKCLQHHR
ncbi:unnamed protein product, partial [Rotaria sordida]